MQQVAADGVAPAHVAPRLADGIVLVEEVILAVVEDEPVGSFMKFRGGVKWNRGRSGSS